MRDVPLSILAIFAHPDDEIGVGSTLAHYSAAGVMTTLVCASRGEAATIYCGDCATPENLADVRTHELECACENLGIGALRWLDWPDGGIAALPRDKAIVQIVALIRVLQPDVIITHPENGLYPHPDHLAVWEIVRAAYDAAADLSQYPRAGAPWATPRLFTRAIPQSYFAAAPEFAAARVELNGQQLPFYATPDEEIDVTLHVDDGTPNRLAAWDCHRSQQNPEGAFTKMPDELRRKMAEEEYFVLAASHVALTPGVHDDLFAGLDGETATAGEAPSDPLEASPVFVRQLHANLSVHRAYVDLYKEYERREPKPEFVELLHTLRDPEQEMLYLLARGARQAGEPAGKVEPEGRLINQGLACLDVSSKGNFLRIATQHAAALYAARASAAANEEEAAVWRELGSLSEEQLKAVKTFRA
jgi:LmbE family N-acetylglucosaminyl deacetylase